MLSKWIRPLHLPYPNTWLKFMSRDTNRSNLVQYSIADVPEHRFNEAIEFMKNGFLAHAPIAKAKNALLDREYVEDITRIWKLILSQRMSYVCLKDGSEEMVKSKSFKQVLRVHSILVDHGKFDVFEKYGVDKCWLSFGMYVPRKYAGRKIGEKLLEASKYQAKPCEIKLRHGFFTSNVSNKIADNLGYKTDVELSLDDIQRIDPNLRFENVKSSKAALRTWIFENGR